MKAGDEGRACLAQKAPLVRHRPTIISRMRALEDLPQPRGTVRLGQVRHEQFLGESLGLGEGIVPSVPPQRKKLLQRRHRLHQQGAKRAFHPVALAHLSIQLSAHIALAGDQVGHVDRGAGGRYQCGAKKVLRHVRRIGFQDRVVAVEQIQPVDFHRLGCRIAPPRRITWENFLDHFQSQGRKPGKGSLAPSAMQLQNRVAEAAHIHPGYILKGDVSHVEGRR